MGGLADYGYAQRAAIPYPCFTTAPHLSIRGSTKSGRRAMAMLAEVGTDEAAIVLQGRLEGHTLLDAGICRAAKVAASGDACRRRLRPVRRRVTVAAAQPLRTAWDIVEPNPG